MDIINQGNKLKWDKIGLGEDGGVKKFLKMSDIIYVSSKYNPGLYYFVLFSCVVNSLFIDLFLLCTIFFFFFCWLVGIFIFGSCVTWELLSIQLGRHTASWLIKIYIYIYIYIYICEQWHVPFTVSSGSNECNTIVCFYLQEWITLFKKNMSLVKFSKYNFRRQNTIYEFIIITPLGP